MKIVCLIKYVLSNDQVDYITNSKKLIVNPCDDCGLEIALRYKDKNPNTKIEVVTMGPPTIKNKTYDLIRKGADKVTILCDQQFRGSDTYATSLIISSYLKRINFDLVISGNMTIDGNTGHVGAQVATMLNICQYSYVTNVDVYEKTVNFKVNYEPYVFNLELAYPCVLSCLKDNNIRPRFVKMENRDVDVSKNVSIVDNKRLKVNISDIGLKGSPTYVKKVDENEMKSKKYQHFSVEEGVEYVYNELKKGNYIK